MVGLGTRSYPIWIGAGILPRLGQALKECRFPRKIAVVTNPRVQDLYGEQVEQTLTEGGFEHHLILLPDGEEHKNWATLQRIYDTLIAAGFDRQSGLIALGGGVIGDTAGFAAATYMRGIPYVQVPTTLLAQVDSSVGGKTAINLPQGKNLIGAFYQPRHVHIDVSTLGSLEGRDFAAGMAEVIKYGVIRDRSFFDWLAAHRDALQKQDAEALIAAVKRACQIKANIVEIDEKESALRAILNLGHTFGHAIENLAGYRNVRHGEAVAIGMVVTALIARRLDLCTADHVTAVRNLLLAFNLPVTPPDFALDAYLEAMMRDKKVHAGTLRLVLNRGIGDCLVREVDDPAPLFAKALQEVQLLEQGDGWIE
jgi:3-dehydroquinate synthase